MTIPETRGAARRSVSCHPIFMEADLEAMDTVILKKMKDGVYGRGK